MRSTVARGAAIIAAVVAIAAAGTPPPFPWAGTGRTRFFALRLLPGQDPVEELQRFAGDRKLQAAFVASCAGSLTRVCVRFANQPQPVTLQGHLGYRELVPRRR